MMAGLAACSSQAGLTHTGTRDAGPACGDGTCDATQASSSCPNDSDQCTSGPICGDGACDATDACSSCPNTSQAAEPVFGVTVDNPWVAEAANGGTLGSRLDGLVGFGGRKPTVRVVFDEGVDQIFRTGGIDASDYRLSVKNIMAHAQIMGELLDSFYVPKYSVSQYRARACEYRATLGDLVDVWEIGNEVNGEWLGSHVMDKLVAATQVFTADAASFANLCPGFTLRSNEKPFKLAMTLYYNGPYDNGQATSGNCWQTASHAMDFWVDQNFASAGAAGTTSITPHLDYVWVSYYEDDCNGIQPNWQGVYDHLSSVFPDARLGFGECGTTNAALKSSYVQRYYDGMDSSDPAFANMKVNNPRYVGGLFWWYFSEDLTNSTVYAALQNALGDPFWSR